MPPTRNISAATTRTGVRGSLGEQPADEHGHQVWSRNALATPIQTSRGRKRVERTRVAMKVLSGSSTRKIVPKTRAATPRLNSIGRRLY